MIVSRPGMAVCGLAISLLSTACYISAIAATESDDSSGPAEVISFKTKVWPLMRDNCIKCHNRIFASGAYLMDSIEGLQKGGTHGVPYTAGQGSDSLLVKMMEGAIKPRMPQGASPLSRDEINTIRTWIDEGATIDLVEGEELSGANVGALTTPGQLQLPAAIESLPATKLTFPLNATIKLKQPGKQADDQLEVPSLTLVAHVEGIAQVPSLAFSPDGKLLAAGSYKEVRIWDVTTGALTRSLTGHADMAHALAFSKDGKRLAVAGGMPTGVGEVKIWDTDKWEVIASLREHGDQVYGVGFSPDGKWVATAALDKVLKVWNTSKWEVVKTLRAHSDQVFDLVWKPDSSGLIACSADHTCKVFDISNDNPDEWKSIRSFGSTQEFYYAVAISPDGKTVVSGGRDNKVHVWNLEDGKEARTLEQGGFVNDLAYGPDGERIASAGGDKNVKLWKNDGGLVHTLTHPDWVYSVSIHPDSKILASGCWDGTVRLWNIEDGRLLAVLVATTTQSPDSETAWLTVTPDGYATGSDDIWPIVSMQLDGSSNSPVLENASKVTLGRVEIHPPFNLSSLLIQPALVQSVLKREKINALGITIDVPKTNDQADVPAQDAKETESNTDK